MTDEIGHLELHRFDKAKHGGFVAVSLSKSLRLRERTLFELMGRYRDSRLFVATPINEPSLFLGWIACSPLHNRIIAIYVKFGFRGTHDGQFHVGSSMAIAAGISFERMVPCSLWSRAARRIAAKPGNPYRLIYAPEHGRRTMPTVDCWPGAPT